MAKKNYIMELSRPKLEEARKTPEYQEFKRKYDKMSKKQGGGLVPPNKLTPDMREEMTRLSQIAKEEKRRGTLALTTTLQTLMQMPLADDDVIRVMLEQQGFDDDMLTEATAMCYAQIQRAKQDTRAFEVVRDTIGQKPVERQEVISAEINTNEILRRHFGDNA